MPFDPDSIERLSPDARVEVQDFYARKFLAARESPVPDRRVVTRPTQKDRPPGVTVRPAAPQRWPRAVWFRNDTSRRPPEQVRTVGRA